MSRFASFIFIGKKLREAVWVILFLLISISGYGQTTIFSETVGASAILVSETEFVNTHSGWQNGLGYTMSGTASVCECSSISLSNQVASWKDPYPSPAPSGAALVSFPNAGKIWQISGINTLNYTSLALSFYIYKHSNVEKADNFSIEVSSDGTIWTSLTMTLLPSGGGTIGWYSRTPTGSIPSVSNLRIRFTQAGGNVLQLDDVKLTGTSLCSPPDAQNGYTSGAGSVTLGASGATGSYRWYDASTLGNLLGTGPTYTTPVISATTTYYVCAVDGSNVESCRVPVIAYLANTYYSRTSANWNASTTWSTNACGDATNIGTYPSTPYDDVYICHAVSVNESVSVHNVTVNAGGVINYGTGAAYVLGVGGNLVVNSSGTFQYSGNSARSHSLNLSGNFTNNGTVDFYSDADDKVALKFNGTTNSIVSGTGTWDMHAVTIHKDTRATVVEVQSTSFYTNFNAGAWTYTKGTYFHNNSVSFNMGHTADFIINDHTEIIVDGNGILNMASLGKRVTLQGKMEIRTGSVNIGQSNTTTAPNGLKYQKGSSGAIPEILISAPGSILNVWTGINGVTPSDPLKFTLAAGYVSLNTGQSPSTVETFKVNDVAGSSFEMGNALMVFQQPNSGGVSDFDICGLNGSVTITSGELQFGNTNTVASSIFKFTPYSSIVLPKLKVTGPVGTLVTLKPSTAGNFQCISLFIDTGQVFDMSHNGSATDSRTMTLTGTHDGIHSFFDNNNGPTNYFIYRNSTVIINTSSTLRTNIGNTFQSRFYNLSCAFAGKTTTHLEDLAIANTLSFNGGTFTSSAKSIYLHGFPDPLSIVPGSIISTEMLKFSASTTQNLPAYTYNCWIVAGGDNVILNQQGAVTCDYLAVNGSWSNTNTCTYNSNGHPITVINNFFIGHLGGTSIKTLNLGSSLVSVGWIFEIFSDGVVNASTSEIRIAGDFKNNSTQTNHFVSQTGTVKFVNGNAQTISGTAATNFYNLTIDKSALNVTLSQPVAVSNILQLTKGNIISASANKLIMKSGSSVSGVSNASFVEGPVQKVGVGIFDFPIGKASVYRPLSISPAGIATDAFTAEYYNINPHPNYDTSSKAAAVQTVSSCEYWRVSREAGSTGTKIKLGYGTGSCGLDRFVSFAVTRWDGSQWTDLGRGTATGDATAGTIESSLSTTSFGQFTIASVPCNLAAPVVTHGSTCGTGPVILAASGSNGTYNWYTASSGGASIHTTSNYTTPSISTTTTYYVSSVESGCESVRVAVNATVSSVSGDTAVFGNGQWNVYGFDGINCDIYKGFFTISPLSFESINFWPDAGSPSDASGYVGCAIPVDNHSARFKRTGFTPGNYTVDVYNFIRNASLYVDNKLVFSSLNNGSDFSNSWTGYLDNTSLVEVRLQATTLTSYLVVKIQLAASISPITPAIIGGNQEFCKTGDPLLFKSGQSFMAEKDAHVSGGASTTNYGTETVLIIKNNTVSTTRLTYIGFDLAGQTSPVNNAILDLFGFGGGSTDRHVKAGIYEVADTTWGETTINYSNSPAYGALLDTLNMVFVNGARYHFKFNVTNYIAAAKLAGKNRVTFLLRQEIFAENGIEINSRENTNPPVLHINAGVSSCSSSYQWQRSVGCTGSWENIIGATGLDYDVPAGLSSTTCFRKVITDACSQVATTNQITVTINNPSTPIITTDTVCGSGAASLSASGSSGTYNWYNVPSGGSSLATTANYTTPVISTTTTYYVSKVENGCEGSRASVDAAVLDNSVGGTVSSSTTECSGINGTTLTLSGHTGSVSGWESSLDNFGTAGTAIANTTTSLSYTNLTQTTSYRAIVQSGSCAPVNSASVTITIDPESVGGTISSAATECSGINGATLTLSGHTGSVTGWESSLDNFSTAGTAIVNTTTSLSYTNLAQTTSYRAIVQSGSCAPVNSASVTITVDRVSVGGTISSAATVCSGTNGATLTLSGHTGSVTGWESSLDNFSTAGTVISNTTTGFAYSNLTQTTSYRAIVQSGTCSSANSASVTITVDPVSIGGTISSAATECSGTNGATLTLSGHTGLVSGWESSLDNFGTAGTPIANTTTSLSYTNLTQTTSYRAIVQSGSCASANSASVTITVDPVSVGGTVSSAATVCSGTNGATLTLSGHTGLVNGWESSLDNFGTAGTPIANTTTSLSYTNLTQTTSYRAIVQSGSCASANSASVTITVDPVSVGGTISSTATVCSGINGATLTLSGHTGTVIRWERSLDDFSTAGIAISNMATSLTYSNLTQTTSYRAIVQSGSCASANSGSVTITVDPSSVGGTISSAATVCSGINGATLTLSGHTGSVSGWESSLDNFGTAGTAIANTTTSLTYSNLTQTTSYRAIVQSGTCASENSASVTITIDPVSVGGTISSAATECSGINGATLTLSGHTGSVSGWESSLDNFGTAGTSIANTTTSLTYSNLTQTTSYRAIVKSGSCASANSASVIITIDPASVGGTVSSAATVCSGTNGASLTLSGFTGSVKSWESSLDNFSTAGTIIANTSASLSYSNLTQTTTYRAIIQSGNCPTENSTSVTITVNPESVGGVLSSDATVCSGSNGATLTLSGYTGSITGWESSLDNFTTEGTAIANTSSSFTYNNLTQTTSYRAIVEATGCPSVNSSVATITTISVSVGGTLSSSATVCSGVNGATLTLTGYSGSITGWESSLDNFATEGTVIANTSSSLTYNNLTQSTSYRVIVEATGCSSVNSSVATITTTSVSVGGILSSAATVCSGTNGATITLSGHTGSIAGWESSLDNFSTSGTAIVNTTTSLSYINLTQTTSYRAIVQSGSCASANSASVTITIDPVSVGGMVSSAATECSGINGATLTLSGHTGSVTGWESSLDNFSTAGTAIVNTTTSLSYTNLTQTTFYRAIIQSGTCTPAYSASVTITVDPVSVGGTLSSAATVCSGTNSATVTLSGHTGSVTGWESSLDNFSTAGTAIVNTTTSLSYTNLTQTTFYRAIIQSGSCATANSASVTITVDPVSVGGTVSSAATVCSGTNGATVTLSGHTGSVSGWESSLDNFGTAGTAIANTSTSLTYSNLTQTTSYRAIVQSGSCASANSASVIITIDPASVGGTVSSAATECSGINGATLTLSGHTGSVSGWESSLDNFGTAGTAIANTTTSLTYSNLTQTTSYRAIVQSGSCPASNSSIVTIAVTTDPAVNTGVLQSDIAVIRGSNSGTLTLSGHSGVIMNWESSVDNFSTSVAITNTTSSLVYTDLSQTTYYKVALQGITCPVKYSNMITVTVRSLPMVNSDVVDVGLNSNYISSQSLLSNDSEQDGDPLIINAITNMVTMQGGTISIDASGNYSYTPSVDFLGTDSVDYVVCNGNHSDICTTIRLYLRVKDLNFTLAIYPSISPNQDNINDEWIIDNIDKYPNNQVSIYDRWGGLIFKAKAYDNSSKVWKGYSNTGGTFGSQELPDGTYFYIIDLGDGSKSRSGYVVLKR